MYHIVIEQTLEYKNRMEFDQSKNTFNETEYQSLAYARNFPHPYGWIKESGTPPGPHLFYYHQRSINLAMKQK